MNVYSTIWKFVVILLSFSIKRCPLLPADCQSFIGLGYLTVEPSPFFLLGSNLTVYCHIKKCQRFTISLELNGETVEAWKRVNCTMLMFKLLNVRVPQSIVLCKQERDQVTKIVHGLDLHGGLPPDKPEHVICETSRNSDFIDCSWERGQETHIRTTYNISVSRENGTQILFDQIQDAENATIPRAMIDENIKYQVIITAYNHFGPSQSDPITLCVKDIVIPDTPRIMQIEFGNNSIVAMLQWKTTDSTENLRSYIRLSADNGPWEAGQGTVLREGLIRVDGLRPLTEYKFQVRTCNSTSGLTHANTPSSRKGPFCSKWSPSVRGTSPGKGPSQQLHLWRTLANLGTNGVRMVTVLWKPPPPEDYSGEVLQYKIFLGNDQKQEVTCPAALNQLPLQVPVEVQALSISVVTSYGTSPPADVPLRHSGGFGPVLRELAPAANGNAVFVSWSWLGNNPKSASGGEVLYYVLQWTSVPAAELQWLKLANDQNSTSITGLTAGVRYNVSLYAVTTRGVSAPSSDLTYFEEQIPVSGPNPSVLAHEAGRILIQWDQLPVYQQKGFITEYTIYLQMLDSSNTELNVTVPDSSLRQKQLECPEGALALQMTASTSAGEGPRGRRISSKPATPAAGLVILIVFTITLLIAILANLMCWSCVRIRIKQTCVSWVPAWFHENLPKPENSFAIRLMEQDGIEQPHSPTYSDPPLSPISLVSHEERDDVYPTIHLETSQVGSERPTAETPLLMSHAGTMLGDSQLENVGYKPQTMLAPQGEEVKETEEEQMDVPTSRRQEDRHSSGFGGLLGGFLSSVDVDFLKSPLGPTLSSVTSVLNVDFLSEQSRAEKDVDSPSLDIQQGEIMTPDTADTCLSQYNIDTTLTSGYFPQVATVSITTQVAGTMGGTRTGQPAPLN
ncbi:interleukin-23 receptor [Pempheris klunzingeri]|uniref:interleukin-23 receptor n=1 Tax=Pempheris klunzingeri TaxID=3127111 RepID=UPI0039815879